MRDLSRMTLRTALGMAHATAIFLDLFNLAPSAKITHGSTGDRVAEITWSVVTRFKAR
jgi:hypothetical protein